MGANKLAVVLDPWGAAAPVEGLLPPEPPLLWGIRGVAAPRSGGLAGAPRVKRGVWRAAATQGSGTSAILLVPNPVWHLAILFKRDSFREHLAARQRAPTFDVRPPQIVSNVIPGG
jgi:hypothetical protein